MVTSGDHLIGSVSVGTAAQRKGHQASGPAAVSAGRRVSARTSASNAWNQNWNSSNPGYQNNNNKTNANRVRAARLPGAMCND